MLYFSLLLVCMHSPVKQMNVAESLSMTITAVSVSIWFCIRLLSKFGNNRFTPSRIIKMLWKNTEVLIKSFYVPTALHLVSRLYQQAPEELVWAWPVGAVAAIVLPYIIYVLMQYKLYSDEHLRGTKMITMQQAGKQAMSMYRPGELLLDWGGIGLPDSLSVGHFLLAGAPGSGKTVSLRLLMQSVLPHICPGSKMRALIYDAKQDILEILSGMNLHCPVVTLNPFDLRGSAWDMARDIYSYATSLQVAANLIPEEEGHNSFFVKAARDLLAAVMIALHLSRPGKWALADVVLILSDKDATRRLLEANLKTRHIAREYFSRDPRTLANIQQTISAHMSMLRPIAAAWAHTTHRISLIQWVREEFILILGNDESLRGPLDALNAAILQRVSQLVLAQTECHKRRNWFFLDEIKEAGKIECIPRLMTKGRSKGVRCLIAFQTIEGLRSVYGQDVAEDIAGLCTNKAFLRTDSVATAKWAAETLGDAEWKEWHRSCQNSTNGSSTSYTEHRVKRESVLASELMRIPLANNNHFVGYFITPGIGVYKGTVPFADRLRNIGQISNFVPRPPEEQYLCDESNNNNSIGTSPLDDLESPWDDMEI